MGRGVMEPEYRGATARRMMREAQEQAAKDRRALEESEERRYRMADRMDSKEADIEGLQKETIRLDAERVAALRDASAVPFLMDMIAEMVAANIAAHNAAMEAIKDAETARATQAKAVAEEE